MPLYISSKKLESPCLGQELLKVKQHRSIDIIVVFFVSYFQDKP
jgi:hypothetical protein